jgi:DNA repair protein RecO (recombination protein O)
VLAIVSGGVDYGDADRVIHLLTQNGRLSVFAHGARKSKKRFAGSLEPFSTITCTLSPKSAHGMPTLSSANVESARLKIRDDLSKIALASYVVELTGRVAPESAPADPLFELVGRTLDRIVDRPVTIAARRAFELRLIDELGYRPAMETCTICGVEPEKTFLDLAIGGVLCVDHRTTAKELGPKTRTWMSRVLDASDPADEEAELGAEWADRAARALTDATEAFFSGLLVKPLSTLRLLGDVGL